MKSTTLRTQICFVAAAIVLLSTGCAQQSAPNQTSPPPAPVAANVAEKQHVQLLEERATLLLMQAGWYLLEPPRRAYASDRTPMMGGPLATSGISYNRGGVERWSVNQVDTSAPLAKWTTIGGPFISEKDCEDVKAAQLTELNDPAFVTKNGARIVSTQPQYAGFATRLAHDIYESERCVSASQIPSH